ALCRVRTDGGRDRRDPTTPARSAPLQSPDEREDTLPVRRRSHPARVQAHDPAELHCTGGHQGHVGSARGNSANRERSRRPRSMCDLPGIHGTRRIGQPSGNRETVRGACATANSGRKNSMTHPVIISCALTGAGDTTAKSPHVPVTPAQIATEALAARAAGAAIVHIHVRDLETGRPSTLPKLYAEVVSRIREARSDVLINLTTGPGGRFVPDAIEPNHNAYPDGMLTSERRMQHVLDLRPDICSLDVGTLNFGTYSFINHPKEVERMAHMMREAGVKPELEVFDLGHAAFV